MRHHRSALERMWEKVDRSSVTGCWPGRADGHWQVVTARQREYAHRLAWQEASGEPIPDGQFVLHTCDNPPCVRNDDRGIYLLDGVEHPRFGHLWLGSAGDNVADMVAKHRQAGGSRNGHSHLSTDQVAAIYKLAQAATMTQREIARLYHCPQSTVSMILNGKSYHHEVYALTIR